MDLHQITRWTPPPGRVVEWTVTERAAEIARSAPESPFPPATIQERHLRRAAAAAARGEAQSPWIGLAFDFFRPLDEQAMARAITEYVRRNETLWSWFSFADPDGDPADFANLMRRHVTDPDSIEFESRTVDVPGTSEAIRDHLMHRFATAATALTWPAFVFGTIEHEGGESFTLFHAVDHAHTDLTSMAYTFTELRTLYDCALDGTGHDMPAAGSFVEFSRRERARAAELTAESPEVASWMEHLRAAGGSMPVFPLDLGAADGPRPAMNTRVILIDGADSERFTDVCRANGGNFVGGVFAALAITERELVGRDRYFALSPLSTRDSDDMEWTQGWFINLIPVGFATADAATFTDLVAAAQDSFRSGKKLGSVSSQQAIEVVVAERGAAAATEFTGLSVPPIVSYMDARSLPRSDEYVQAHATGLVGGKDTAVALMWVNRLDHGTWIDISHPDTPQARESVERYTRRLTEIMTAVARDGDHRIAPAEGTL
ncbi:condensation domain-containing protein [Rhodococcus olei]|uniref:Condensation domain-containing protein n=1 Tax=Rhodococcus olei TaxID=2161675 RepID=A0ABP8NSP9_9NOCA